MAHALVCFLKIGLRIPIFSLMKTNRTLRLLSLLGFLLLLAPFYDSCNGSGFTRIQDATDVPLPDTTVVAMDSRSTDVNKIDEIKVDTTQHVFEEYKPSFVEKTYDAIVDEESFTGFEIASFLIFAVQDITFKEFKEEIPRSFETDDWYKDIGMFISFLFDFIVLISFSLLILSFFKKQKLFTKLALANCILVIITFLYIICLEKSFEHIRQIKWGYYAFIITNLLIFYYSKLASKPHNS